MKSLGLIEARRRGFEQVLEKLRGIDARPGEDPLFVDLVLRWGLAYTAWEVQWCAEQLELLGEAKTANALWGLSFLGSAAIRRPLAGALACAWYPFPPEFRETALFKRVYGAESACGACTCSRAARSASQPSSTAASGVSSLSPS